MNESISRKRILLTGGHLTPAIAVLEELQKRGHSDFVWVGQKFNQQNSKNISPEYSIITDKNIPFVNLKSGKLIRSVGRDNFLYAIKQIFLLFYGFVQALYIILRYRPKLVITFGGFLAVPVVFWAWVFRKKIVTHEQTVVAGLSNKIIAKFANKVLISWDSSRRYFSKKKTVWVGNPIRKEVIKYAVSEQTREVNKTPIVFFTGGNQGAHEINKRVFDILPKLLDKAIVVHQTGNSSATKDFEKARSLYRELDKKQQNRYFFRDYYKSEEMAELLFTSDLVVARAGANTITELLLLNKLAILIPIPWVSHNEQYLNAKLLKDIGLGYIIEQNKAFTADKLYQAVTLGLTHSLKGVAFDGKPMDVSAAKARSIVRTNSHKLIADEVEKLLVFKH